jgi:hypothetical protein
MRGEFSEYGWKRQILRIAANVMSKQSRTPNKSDPPIWRFVRGRGVLKFIKVKCKIVLVLNQLSTMPWRHMGEWRYSSTTVDLGASCRWVFSFAPRPLYPWGKSRWCPLDRRLDGPQNRSGYRREDKIFCLCREPKTGRPGRSSFLYRLSFLGS